MSEKIADGGYSLSDEATARFEAYLEAYEAYGAMPWYKKIFVAKGLYITRHMARNG